LSKTGFSEAADTYHVIHVNGTIQIRASGKLLEVGDKISSEDEIVFKTQTNIINGLSGAKKIRCISANVPI
jgi:hypothetical protein